MAALFLAGVPQNICNRNHIASYMYSKETSLVQKKPMGKLLSVSLFEHDTLTEGKRCLFEGVRGFTDAAQLAGCSREHLIRCANNRASFRPNSRYVYKVLKHPIQKGTARHSAKK